MHHSSLPIAGSPLLRPPAAQAAGLTWVLPPPHCGWGPPDSFRLPSVAHHPASDDHPCIVWPIDQWCNYVTIIIHKILCHHYVVLPYGGDINMMLWCHHGNTNKMLWCSHGNTKAVHLLWWCNGWYICKHGWIPFQVGHGLRGTWSTWDMVSHTCVLLLPPRGHGQRHPCLRTWTPFPQQSSDLDHWLLSWCASCVLCASVQQKRISS